MNDITNRKIKISLYRYNPELHEKPFMQDFEVNTSELPGVMLLNALEHIKDKLDNTFVFRRSCGEGVCGSDGMNINGKNGLACITNLSSLSDKVIVRPLPGFPVIRDLAVDMSQFFEQHKRAIPFLINTEQSPMRERLQSPADREKLDGLYECILCACCSSACPSYWWNPDKFMGPAALLTSARFVADSRDNAKRERLEGMQDPFSLFRCRGIMNCVSVCPKGLNPTQAINFLRNEMLQEQI
jgi:succinate dehydrogenase / fumarate reductase, iron-sulfur subunit